MAISINRRDNKQVGLYLIAAELSRMGFLVTTFRGSGLSCDIRFTNEVGKSSAFKINATSKSKWRFRADDFCKVRLRNNVQEVLGKLKLTNLDQIYVLIIIKDRGNDRIFILLKKELQDLIYKNYKIFLNKYNGIRPKDPESTYFTITTDMLKDFEDNWELVLKI